jgi:hypothetical protein
MKVFLWVLPVVLVSLVVAGPMAQPSAQGSPFRPASTVKDIMDDIVIPASDVVFGAVGSTTNAAGQPVDKAPRTDEEWDVVRKNARLLMEGANLLMIEGRRVSNTKSAHPGAELEPEQMEALIAKDRAGWVQRAQGLIEAGMVVMKTVDAKDADALLNAGGDLDEACENCHSRFWYPNQKP